MKYFISAIALSALSFCAPVTAVAQDTQWVQVDTTDDGEIVELNSRDIGQGSNNPRARVWIRFTALNGNVVTVLSEIDCQRSTWRALQMTMDRADGTMDTWPLNDPAEYIIPETRAEMMESIACNDGSISK